MYERAAGFIETLSSLLGWIYTISWSASFYPQPIHNYRLKSTHGQAIDFPFLNAIGFICYTISTTCLLYSPEIRAQYASRHPLSPEPTVQFNDFAFGAHAIVLTLTTYSQFFPRIWRFDVHKSQRVSRPVRVVVWGCATGLVTTLVLMFMGNGLRNQDHLHWAWLDVIYVFGYVKLMVTFVKYMPQAWLNFCRKSTAGWSIGQILLDFNGGVLSMTQLIMDSSIQNDWSGLIGNPTKFGLSVISLGFDIIFIVQHYVLYGDRNDEDLSRDHITEQEALLDAER